MTQRRTDRTAEAEAQHNSSVYGGKELESSSIEITPELVAKYTGGLAGAHRWYDGASPYGGPIAPAAILYYQPWWRFPGWGLRGRQGVNASADWEFYRSVRIGETLTLKGRILDRLLRRGRELVEMEMVATNESGDDVCKARIVMSYTGE